MPEAVMESSVISAYRTAASAALGADTLRGPMPALTAGILGCGLINFETLRFLLKLRSEIQTILLFDLSRERALQYQQKCKALCGGREVLTVDSADAVFGRADILSIATTATVPHMDRLSPGGAADVILHISLRDFTPRALLMADNIVDDVEHVCSNRTSLDLTARQQGNREFIRTTIGAILSGDQPPRVEGKPAMFSPFGLGILDLALAHIVRGLAVKENVGTSIADFLPRAWTAGRY